MPGSSDNSSRGRPFVDPVLLLIAQHDDALLTDAEAQDATMVALRGYNFSAKSVRSYTQEVPTIEINMGDTQPTINQLVEVREDIIAAFQDKGVFLDDIRVVADTELIRDKMGNIRG